jgi:hypothetical protein
MWYPAFAMPGVPLGGCVHLSSSGSVVETSLDTSANLFSVSLGQPRVDGRHFHYPAAMGGTLNPDIIQVHLPNTTTPIGGWYIPSAAIPIAPGPLGYQDNLVIFYLDGSQHLSALMMTTSTYPNHPANLNWRRYPSEAPYANPPQAQLGAPFQATWSAGTLFWTSFWGQATLHEYCLYTDPLGDLDQDGVPNQAELRNRTNPCVHSSQSLTVSVASAPPGSWISVDYTVPGDAGLPFFGPFAFSASATALGGGYTVPFPITDALVLESLAPHWPWIQNTLGVLDSAGHVQTRIQIPPLPALSGLQFYGSLLTRDPAAGTLLKTISGSVAITIQ